MARTGEAPELGLVLLLNTPHEMLPHHLQDKPYLVPAIAPASLLATPTFSISRLCLGEVSVPTPPRAILDTEALASRRCPSEPPGAPRQSISWHFSVSCKNWPLCTAHALTLQGSPGMGVTGLCSLGTILQLLILSSFMQQELIEHRCMPRAVLVATQLWPVIQ